MKIFPAVLYLLLISQAFSQVDTVWTRRYNETICGIDYATAIACDSFNNIYVTGWTGTSNMPDFLTIKINSIGETLWTRTYNGQCNGGDWAYAIAVDNQGNVYVTGESEDDLTSYDIVTIKYNTYGTEQWIVRFDGQNRSEDYPCAVKVDNQGNVYVSGTSFNDITDYDYVLIKYNSNGIEQWVQRYNGTGNDDDIAYAMAIDSAGNIYLTGESNGGDTEADYLTIKYNSEGVLQWTARYDGTGESYDYAYAIAVDNQGNVCVTGSSGDVETDNDYITIKYNSAGNQQWYRRYDGTGNDEDVAYAVAVDESGNIYVTGESFSSNYTYDFATLKYNSSGTRQWTAQYNGSGNNHDYAYNLAIDNQGSVYVIGESYGSNSQFDYVTIKYNTNGVQQWLQTYNGTNNSNDYPSAIVIDNQNNVCITGASDGLNTEFDYVTIKYNSIGTQQWLNRYNGTGNSIDQANAIAIDSLGNIYVTGTSFGSGTKNDYLTIKYGSDGIQQWVTRYNGTANNDDYAYSIAVDNSGNTYVAGESQGISTDFDCLTVKYNAAGLQEWVQRYNRQGNSYDWANCLTIDNSGNVYVTGGSEDFITDFDIITIKYNSVGQQQWLQRYNGQSNSIDYGNAIITDDLGNVYVTGTSHSSNSSYDCITIKYNANGIEQWVQRYNGPANLSDAGYAIAKDNQGNIYVAGRSMGVGTARDYLTIKYNAFGQEQWVQRYNGPANYDDMAYAIAIDNSGNVYVTGENKGIGTLADYLTIKYNSNGVEQWVQRYNGNANETDIARAIALDNQNNVYVTGTSNDIYSKSDIVTIKYNSDGVEQWIKKYNGPRNRNDDGSALTLDNQGNVYVTGTSQGIGTSGDYVTIKYTQTQGIEENRQSLSADRLMLDAAPNPFRIQTKIRYALPAKSKISLQIFNISGRLVKTLVDEIQNSGVYNINWNGENDKGKKVGQGVYFYILKVDDKKLEKKLLMLK